MNKSTVLQDYNGNNIYPIIPYQNVFGLPSASGKQKIFFGDGAPNSIKSNYKDVEVNDIYINTNAQNRQGYFYVVTSIPGEVVAWGRTYGFYTIQNIDAPNSYSIYYSLDVPGHRPGIIWLNITNNKIFVCTGSNSSGPTWKELTDFYTKSEVDALFDELQFKINKKAKKIKDTAKGSSISLTDSAGSPLNAISIMGKSTQNGTPTIDTPIPIVDITSEEVQVKKRNLLTIADVNKQNLFKIRSTYIYNTTTNEYEITCTESGDIQLGDYRQQGQTSTEYSFNNMVIKTRIEEGKTYKISSKNGVFTRFLVFIYDDNRKVLLSPASASTVTITAPSGSKWLGVRADISNGTSGTVYKDMIMVSADGDSTYEEPINPQTATLTKTLRGIPVSSGGNYTDNNGQQWLCDTVERYKDGSGKLIQRIVSYTFDGTEDWRTETNKISLRLSPVSGSAIFKDGRILCSHLQRKSTNDAGDYCYNNIKVIYFNKNSKWGTAEQLKAFLATENINCILAKAAPIETPLTAEELAQLDLSTYKPITNIISNTDVTVTYVADTKNYIDKRMTELQNAIISQGGNI